jgi:hypothetical protein
MSFLINDNELLESLIRIGFVEESKSLNKRAQSLTKYISNDVVRSEAKSYFLERLSTLKSDQIGTDSGEDISIELQNNPKQLISYLSGNKITVGNELVVSEFNDSQKDSNIELVKKDSRYMVAGNFLIRKDLLSKYLSDVRRRLSGTPKEADVSMLIDDTEKYIRTNRQTIKDGYNSIFGVDENFKVERAENQVRQQKTTDNTVMDTTIPDIIGEDYVYRYDGKIHLYVGDLRDESSLIEWIKSNQNIKFVDNSGEPDQTISWLGNPNKTNDMKNILIDFLIARSANLLERESDARRKQIYQIYNNSAKQLKSSIKQQKGNKNSADINQESMNKLLSGLNRMWPFIESGSAHPTIRMQIVEDFFDNMSECLPPSLAKINNRLGKSIQSYNSNFGNVKEVSVDESHVHIMKKISPGKQDKANFVGYLGILSELVTNLKLTLEAIDNTTLRYYPNASEWSSKLKEQISFCRNFEEKIDGSWERAAMLLNL